MTPFKKSPQIDDQTKVSLPLEKQIKLLLAAAGIVVTCYAARDRVMADVQKIVAVAVAQETTARRDAYGHLATKEDLQRVAGELKSLIIERTKR